MRVFYLAQFHFEKIQAGKLTFKVSDKKSRLTSQMCPKLKIKTLEASFCYDSTVLAISSYFLNMLCPQNVSHSKSCSVQICVKCSTELSQN